jgi:hypothetical protein
MSRQWPRGAACCCSSWRRWKLASHEECDSIVAGGQHFPIWQRWCSRKGTVRAIGCGPLVGGVHSAIVAGSGCLIVIVVGSGCFNFHGRLEGEGDCEMTRIIPRLGPRQPPGPGDPIVPRLNPRDRKLPPGAPTTILPSSIPVRSLNACPERSTFLIFVPPTIALHPLAPWATARTADPRCRLHLATKQNARNRGMAA